ncbi:ACP S-malonyltransferase [Eupransor demetentiae]|uniref:Malonyl CoA-acyl carrier protein transacylase n=1 Tax=Eupransor demetentiae TaxID=3109584 RepID=A0ABP0EQ64_9LACO|nr:Malonyl CoA-acyl carrier protein transacylase (FabD) [Lactobacillaceae bacterium LMG 33000]
MKVGLLFSGQGAQQVDMGMDLYDALPAYKERIDQASQVLGYDLTEVMTDEVKIKQTEFAQPAIVAMSLGILAALGDALPKPTAALGLSLGEYSALTAAGAMDFDQVIAILKDRGHYMQAVGDKNPGKMVAVMGDDQDLIVRVFKECQDKGLQVWPANFNTFSQLVIGGVTADVEEAVGELLAAGIKRTIDLPVTGAFHTPLLNEAAEQLGSRLSSEKFNNLDYLVYSNTTAKPFESQEIKEVLTKQIVSPTYFAQDLQQMVDAGVDTLIEIGPGKTLTKFAKKIAPKEIERLNIGDLTSFEETKAFLEDAAKG